MRISPLYPVSQLLVTAKVTSGGAARTNCDETANSPTVLNTRRALQRQDGLDALSCFEANGEVNRTSVCVCMRVTLSSTPPRESAHSPHRAPMFCSRTICQSFAACWPRPDALVPLRGRIMQEMTQSQWRLGASESERIARPAVGLRFQTVGVMRHDTRPWVRLHFPHDLAVAKSPSESTRANCFHGASRAMCCRAAHRGEQGSTHAWDGRALSLSKSLWNLLPWMRVYPRTV